MSYNIVSVTFGSQTRVIAPEIEYQFDVQQILVINGLELPEYYTVEFCNEGDAETQPALGTDAGVAIPNNLLQTGDRILAYLVLSEDDSVQTRREIVIPVRQRPVRGELARTQNEKTQLDHVIELLETAVEDAQEAAEDAEAQVSHYPKIVEGYWYVYDPDEDTWASTGIRAEGEQGDQGDDGITPDIQIGTVTTGAPGSQAAASITGTREEPLLNLTIPQGPQGEEGVLSVNGETGEVVIEAADLGAYVKPAGGIPKTDLASNVQTSLGKADTALQHAPVTSVNNKTGAVVLTAVEVGAKPESYEAPVLSVNGKAGAVELDASDVGAKPESYEAPVSSVNSKTGAVVLDAGDIGYESTTVEEELDELAGDVSEINSALTSLSAVTEIIDTASGAIASFPDGAGLPMRSLVAEINPVQDLHGQPNPYPAGGGVNKMPPLVPGTYTVKGYTAVVDNNGLITVSGQRTESGGITINIPFETPCNATTSQYAHIRNSIADGNLSLSFGTFSPGLGVANRIVQVSSEITEWTQLGIYFGGGYTETASFTLQPSIEDTNSVTDWTPYSNICPISGWTGVQGQRTGKNLIDKSKFDYGADNNFVWGYRGEGFLLKGGASYVFTTNTDPSSMRLVSVDESTVYAEKTATSRVNYTPTEDTLVVFRLWNGSGQDLSTLTVQLEVGSTASTYEEYHGEPISVSWQDEAGTVYGGTLDVVSGLLTVTHKRYDVPIIDFDQSTSTSLFRLENASWFYEVVEAGNGQGYIPAKSNICNANIAYNAVGSNKILFWTVSQFGKTAYELAEEDPTLVVQMFLPLLNPITYQLTPQEVDTLLGQNNVWVDTGDVSVTYQANLKGYIDKVLGS